MATNPTFTSTARVGIAQISAANTNRDGTGTIVDALTGAAAGSKAFEIRVQATVTTTAGMVRIYLYNGTTYVLYDEIPVTVAAVSASAAGFESVRLYPNLLLPSNSWKIAASTHNAETFNVFVAGGDLT